MNDLPFVRRFLRILVDPGWVPFGVVLFHVTLAEFGLTHRFDHLLHFLGGMAIAYFFFRVFALLSVLPTTDRWLIYAATFTSSCTAALFWEFVEFASDTFLHSHVQQSLSETMLDLVFGVLGAISSLALITDCPSRFLQIPSSGFVKCSVAPAISAEIAAELRTLLPSILERTFKKP